MRSLHSDILGGLKEEAKAMSKWVEKNRRDVDIERILTTEESVIEVEEIRMKLESIFRKCY